MSEQLVLHDPLYKLAVRFGNGEVLTFVLEDPLDSRAIKPETRYAIVSSFLRQNPVECTEVAALNMRDITFLRTERVTLEQLAISHRMPGIGSPSKGDPDDRLPKVISQITFI